MSLVIIEYFHFLFLIEPILENILLGNAKHVDYKDNWYLECWNWSEPCKKLSALWIIAEITAHMCTVCYNLYQHCPYITSFEDQGIRVPLVTFGVLSICKGLDNFLFGESADSDQHPTTGRTRKSCGGLCSYLIPHFSLGSHLLLTRGSSHKVPW